MRNQTDRREHPRLQTTYGAVATLGKSKFGIITEISRGGLAFRYIPFDHKEELQTESPAISIVYDAVGFSMQNIPCQIIRDYCRNSEPYPASPARKTCCIQFDRLTVDQKLQLEFFIAHFTAGASSGSSLSKRL